MTITIESDVQTPLATSNASQAKAGYSNHDREALAMFADELSAHRYLERVLWPNGVYCPRCGSDKVRELNGASTRLGTCKCYGCRKMFSILHGTFMSGSHVPAHKWLQAMYLTEGGAKPMQPYHLYQILNVSHKTAASMMRRLKLAAAKIDDREPDGTGIPLERLPPSNSTYASPGLTLAG